MARWFKERFKGLSLKGTVPFLKLIDSGDLIGLTSKTPWSKSFYFNEYKKSFEKGEYNLREQVNTPTGQMIRSYVSGGIQIMTSSPLQGGFKKIFDIIINMENRKIDVYNKLGKQIWENLKFLKGKQVNMFTGIFTGTDKVLNLSPLLLESFLIKIPSHKEATDIVDEFKKSIEEIFSEHSFTQITVNDKEAFLKLFNKKYNDPEEAMANINAGLEWLKETLTFRRLFLENPVLPLSDDEKKTLTRINSAYQKAIDALPTPPWSMTGSSPLTDKEIGEEIRDIGNRISPLIQKLVNEFKAWRESKEKKGEFPALLTLNGLERSEYTRFHRYGIDNEYPFRFSNDLREKLKGEKFLESDYAKYQLSLDLERIESSLYELREFVGIYTSEDPGSLYYSLQDDTSLEFWARRIERVSRIFKRYTGAIFSFREKVIASNIPEAEKMELLYNSEQIYRTLQNDVVRRLNILKEAVEKKASSALNKQKITPEQVSSSPALNKLGGIDFRSMQMLIQPMGSFSNLNLSLPTLSSSALQRIDLDKELAALRNMVKAGMVPSGVRVKEYLSAVFQKGRMEEKQDDLLLCLAEIYRLQEEEVLETSPELRESLVIVDTGRFVLLPNSQRAGLN